MDNNVKLLELKRVRIQDHWVIIASVSWFLFLDLIPAETDSGDISATFFPSWTVTDQSRTYFLCWAEWNSSMQIFIIGARSPFLTIWFRDCFFVTWDDSLLLCVSLVNWISRFCTLVIHVTQREDWKYIIQELMSRKTKQLSVLLESNRRQSSWRQQHKVKVANTFLI